VEGGKREGCARGANKAGGATSSAIAAPTVCGAADTARTWGEGPGEEGGWRAVGGGKLGRVRGANEARGTASGAIAATTACGAAVTARTWGEGPAVGGGRGEGGALGAANAGVDVAAGGKDHTVGIRRENNVERRDGGPVGACADDVAVETFCAPPPCAVPPKVRWLIFSFFVGCGVSGSRLGDAVDEQPLPPPRQGRRPCVLRRAGLRTRLRWLPPLPVPACDDDEVGIVHKSWK